MAQLDEERRRLAYIDLVRRSVERDQDNVRRRRLEWIDANRDGLNESPRAIAVRNEIFALIQEEEERMKRYTNYPKSVINHVYDILLPLMTIVFGPRGLNYCARNAIVITLTYLTNAMHYKTLANVFMEGRIKISRIVNKTLPFLVDDLPGPKVCILCHQLF